MIGGLMKSTSHYALAAAAGLFAGALAISPAKAADLGGDCCADLEERVAELEATTVRKGNRVVSVQLYGQVNRALLIWDDGRDSDAYIVDNDASNSRFGFRGSAALKPGWEAGFRFEAEINDAESGSVNQFKDGDDTKSQSGEFFTLRRTSLYVESQQLGRVTIGQTSAATDDLTLIRVGGAVDDADNYYAAGFVVRTATDILDPDETEAKNITDVGGPSGPLDVNGDGDTVDSVRVDQDGDGLVVADGADAGTDPDLDPDDTTVAEQTAGAAISSGFLTWGDLHSSPDFISRQDMVRYDSPSFYGFIVSAAWGDNDIYDFALRFSREWNSIRIAAGIGYGVRDDSADDADNVESFQGSGGIQHVPSGLFVNVSAGTYEHDVASSYEADVADGSLTDDTTSTGTDESSYWWVQGGVERNFTGYGATTIWGQYGQYDDFAAVGSDVTFTNTTTGGLYAVTGSEVNRWGFGINQEFDSAAMQIYLVGNIYELDSLDGVDVEDGIDDGESESSVLSGFDDFFSVTIGSRIRF